MEASGIAAVNENFFGTDQWRHLRTFIRFLAFFVEQIRLGPNDEHGNLRIMRNLKTFPAEEVENLTWHDPRNVSESSSCSANDDLIVSLPLSLFTISINQFFKFSCDFLFVASCTRMMPLTCW
jgi:hypothetical protein